MKYSTLIASACCLTILGACKTTPETSSSAASSSVATLNVVAPEGAGCYRPNTGRDNMLRRHLLALQEGEKTPDETVSAIKSSVESGGFPFNQVPAAESAAAYALSGGDIAAWKGAYEAYAEPGETGRTTFLNSLCWVPGV